MPRGNGQACCILGVCCRSGSVEQREALAKALSEVLRDAPGGLGERSLERTFADYIIDNFDLAPQGSLEALKQAVAQMAPGRSDHAAKE